MRGGKGVADTATLCVVLQMNDEREGKGGRWLKEIRY